MTGPSTITTMPRPLVQATILPPTAITKRQMTTSRPSRPASSPSKTSPRAATRIAKAANGRGGRRNRHRNGGDRQDNRQENQPENQPESQHGQPDGSEETFASAEELSAPTSAEPELSNAVADLDASPPPPRKPRVSAEAPAASPAAEAEPVRRRSTVR